MESEANSVPVDDSDVTSEFQGVAVTKFTVAVLFIVESTVTVIKDEVEGQADDDPVSDILAFVSVTVDVGDECSGDSLCTIECDKIGVRDESSDPVEVIEAQDDTAIDFDVQPEVEIEALVIIDCEVLADCETEALVIIDCEVLADCETEALVTIDFEVLADCETEALFEFVSDS